MSACSSLRVQPLALLVRGCGSRSETTRRRYGNSAAQRRKSATRVARAAQAVARRRPRRRGRWVRRECGEGAQRQRRPPSARQISTKPTVPVSLLPGWLRSIAQSRSPSPTVLGTRQETARRRHSLMPVPLPLPLPPLLLLLLPPLQTTPTPSIAWTAPLAAAGLMYCPGRRSAAKSAELARTSGAWASCCRAKAASRVHE